MLGLLGGGAPEKIVLSDIGGIRMVGRSRHVFGQANGVTISDRPESRTSRQRRLRPLVREHAPLLTVVALGFLLRVYLFFAYRPIAAGFNDSITYLYTSKDHLFSDPWRMAGYPFFLRIVRYIVPQLRFLVGVQDALGLATGVLLYFSVRRVIGGRWLPVLPAAFFLLSGDYLLLEHSVLTETLYIFFVTAAVFGVIFVATATSQTLRLQLLFLGVSGVLLGAASTVRSVGIPLVVFLPLWLLVFGRPAWRVRLVSASALFVPAAAVLAGYVVLQAALTGFWGILPSGGWGIYMRVAPIADCRDFEPPPHTGFLCQTTPIMSRPGPQYYQYVAGPAIQHFGNPFQTNARGSGTVGRFARAVVLAEPLQYLREVGRDMLRYISPNTGRDRPYAGPGSDELDLTRRQADVEQTTIEAAHAVGFGGGSVSVWGSLTALGDFQQMLRVTGFMLVALLGLACSAIVFGSAVVRSIAALLFGCAILQALAPVLTLSWGYRYGVVGMGELMAAAALGIYALGSRFAGDQSASSRPTQGLSDAGRCPEHQRRSTSFRTRDRAPQ
jgi:hypothetical protein